MAKRKPADPAFAAEMAQLAEDHHQAGIGTFREEWQERLARDLPPGPGAATPRHAHSEDCLSEPHQAQAAGGQWLWVRRCAKSNVSIEVPAP